MNRTRYIINKIFYSNISSTKKNYSFIMICGFLLLVFGVVLILFNVSGNIVEFLELKIVTLSLIERIKWFHAFVLLLALSVISHDVFKVYYRFILSEDLDVLMKLPLSFNEILFGKILERTYIKAIFIFVFLLFLFISFIRSLDTRMWISWGIVFIFVLVLILSHLIRIMIVIEMLMYRLANNRLILFIIFLFFIKVIQTMLVLYLMKPFIQISDHTLTLIYTYIINLPIVQGVYLMIERLPTVTIISNITVYNHVTYTILTINSLLLLLAGLVVIQKKRVETFNNRQLLTDLYQLRRSRIFRRSNSKVNQLTMVRRFISKLVFLHPHVRFILMKDICLFLRDTKYRWHAAFISMVVSIVFFLFILYFINFNLTTFPLDFTLVGMVIIQSILFIISKNIVNRFSIDSEGENIKNLLLAPVLPKHMAFVKLLEMIVLLIPSSFIIFISTYLVLKIPIVILTLFILSSLITAVTISLVSSTTFPNFDNNSLMDLPTARSNMLMTILFSGFLSINVIIHYIFHSNLLLFLCVYTGINMLLSLFLFQILCKKIQEVNFRNYESLTELLD